MVRAGVARVPITPPPGVAWMRGFASRHQPAQSIHDPLWATALVLAGDAGLVACLIACDLCAISPADARRLECRVGAVLGLPSAAVWIACSHTHSGPRVALPPPGATVAEAAAVPEGPYSLWLADQLAGCAFLAARDLRPARAGTASGEARIGVNRRERRPDGRIVLGVNPGGPMDHTTTLVRLDDGDGRPLAALLHHACHPVVLGPDNYALSADWVGEARAAAEAALGAPVLFLQGACGNINAHPRGDFAVARRLGQRVGGEAVRLWSEALTEPLAEVRSAASRFEVTLGPLPTEAEAAAELDRRRGRLAEAESKGEAGAAAQGRMYVAWAEEALRAARAGHASAEVTLRAMRCGGFGLVAAPFEPFIETALAVRGAAPLRPLVFCGYTGGVLTYLPVAEAYPEGGYEVEEAFRHFGLAAPPVPETEGRVREALLQLLARL